MKKKIFISKSIKSQKKIYKLLIGLAFVSILFGIIFIFLINNDTKILLSDKIKEYFNSDIDLFNNFFKCLFNNFIIILLIWILGISIIGIPIVLIIFIFKSFLLGFSISSLISTYGISGLFILFFHIILNKGLYLVILILISFYSISFSIKLLKLLFSKKGIDFKESIRKYTKVLLISLVISFFISLYEGVISNYILNFFY